AGQRLTGRFTPGFQAGAGTPAAQAEATRRVGPGTGRGAYLETRNHKGATAAMARLAGVDLPREKRLEIALTYIYGIGRTRSKETLSSTGLNPDTRVKDLSDDDVVKLRDYIEENFRVEGDLRREVNADIRRKIEIGCYEGL